MRLEDAVAYFLSQWPSEGSPADTVRTYGGHLKWLCSFANANNKSYLSDLTPDLLRSAMAAKMVDPTRRARSMSTPMEWKDGKSSARGMAHAVRKLAAWLQTQGIPVADLSAVKIPKPPERVQPRLRAHEFRALEDAILKRLVSRQRIARATIARDLALIHLLADTGLRAYELVGMEIRSVDFLSGSITVYGKGQKERSLSLVDASEPSNSTTLRLLHDWIAARAGIRGAERHTRLWVSMKGRPFTRDQLRITLNAICRDAGLDENRPPHTFRRASFTENYRASPTSLAVLAARMGWSRKSHSMVDTYVRGAELDLARETPVPSVSQRWKGPSSL